MMLFVPGPAFEAERSLSQRQRLLDNRIGGGLKSAAQRKAGHLPPIHSLQQGHSSNTTRNIQTATSPGPSGRSTRTLGQTLSRATSKSHGLDSPSPLATCNPAAQRPALAVRRPHAGNHIAATTKCCQALRRSSRVTALEAINRVLSVDTMSVGARHFPLTAFERRRSERGDQAMPP